MLKSKGASWTAKPLPKINTHADLFFDYKHQNENIGLVDFKKKDLQLWRLDNYSRVGFFEKGIFQNFDWDHKGTWLTNPDKYFKYQTEIENYVKLVWLSKDYINNNGFKNPVCVHYNPHIGKWIVHPGGSRKKVLHYFLEGTINVIAFNNCNKDLNFIKVFNNLDDIKQHFNNDDIKMVVVSDHGSLIPHIHFDQNIIDKNIQHHFYHVKQFFRTTKIEANFDMFESFGYDESKILVNQKKIIKLRISDPNDVDMQDRAMILAPSFDTFNNYGVRIERT